MSNPSEGTVSNSEVNPDPLFDAKTAAAYLGLPGVVKHPPQSVRHLCRTRQIQSTFVAGKVMIRRSWLEEYIRKNMRKNVE